MFEIAPPQLEYPTGGRGESSSLDGSSLALLVPDFLGPLAGGRVFSFLLSAPKEEFSDFLLGEG